MILVCVCVQIIMFELRCLTCWFTVLLFRSRLNLAQKTTPWTRTCVPNLALIGEGRWVQEPPKLKILIAFFFEASLLFPSSFPPLFFQFLLFPFFTFPLYPSFFFSAYPSFPSPYLSLPTPSLPYPYPLLFSSVSYLPYPIPSLSFP